MRAYADSTELRKNQLSVRNDIGKSGLGNTIDQLCRSESSFSSGTPDIYAPRIQYQQPTVEPGQLFAQGIERQFIIGTDKYGRSFLGDSDSIESRFDRIIHPANAPAYFPCPKHIPDGQLR
ncbi:hypothetical protein SDC9_116910 [bioreactor metagenome]|uniref:Uncharacterized protein n=1 Tax=bioreactor metagenome TaxID=1076179 RepID=A0A645BXC8_9ZZZZ